MHIKKIGHCCLVIDVDGVRILTDPGHFTVGEHISVTRVDAVLITHEHGDHFHVESLKEVLKLNPQAKVYTNSSVGKLLAVAGVPFEVVEGTGKAMIKNLEIEALDAKHAEIFEEMGQVQNTGYWIGPKLFYPGDAYPDPGKPVDILALPVAGPFARVSEVMRYALKVKPRTSFPVHDGMMRSDLNNFAYTVYEKVLKERGSGFVPMGNGAEADF